MAEEFYAEHKGKSFYPGLVEFMTSGPIVALVLAKADDAIKGWRELMGPTDVFEARVRAPKRCVPPGSAKHIHVIVKEQIFKGNWISWALPASHGTQFITT